MHRFFRLLENNQPTQVENKTHKSAVEVFPSIRKTGTFGAGDVFAYVWNNYVASRKATPVVAESIQGPKRK